eukprot:COSAG01_NODE_57890_length_309_cov_1.042857_1_plen_48_part_01
MAVAPWRSAFQLRCGFRTVQGEAAMGVGARSHRVLLLPPPFGRGCDDA